MSTLVARIQEVLHGHSARAQIRAVDAQGHELKLEVPVEAARGLSAEHVVVLNWSAHLVPARVALAEPDEAPTTGASDAAPGTPSSEEVTAGPSAAARQLATLIGLKLE